MRSACGQSPPAVRAHNSCVAATQPGRADDSWHVDAICSRRAVLPATSRALPHSPFDLPHSSLQSTEMLHATRTVLRLCQQATSCPALQAPSAAGLPCRVASAASWPSRQQPPPSARRGPQHMTADSAAVLRRAPEAKRSKSMTEAASGPAAQQLSAAVAEPPRQQTRPEEAGDLHRQSPTMQACHPRTPPPKYEASYCI